MLSTSRHWVLSSSAATRKSAWVAIAATTTFSATSNSAARKRRPKPEAKVWSAIPPNSTRSAHPSVRRSSRPQRSRKAAPSAASSALTADPRQPKRFSSTKTAKSCASPISSPTGIPSRTRLRCSRICAAKSKRRALNSRSSGSQPLAMPRTF